MTPERFRDWIKTFDRELRAPELAALLRDLGEDRLAEIIELQRHMQVWDIVQIAESAACLFPDEVIFGCRPDVVVSSPVSYKGNMAAP